MAAHRSPRRVLVAATIATATAGSLLVPAAPASAAFEQGRVGAYGSYHELNNADDCSYHESDVSAPTRPYSPSTGRRTARFDGNYRATPLDDGAVSAHGRIETATSGVTEFRDGRFQSLVYTANHYVRITDDTPSDCGMRLVAMSLGSAAFRSARGGRVHLEWDRGSIGTFEWISVRRNGDRVYERVHPDRAHGETTFRLRRGEYYTISVHFRLRASEREVPVGQTLTKRTHFRVAANYVR